jgi:hypothetical protein
MVYKIYIMRINQATFHKLLPSMLRPVVKLCVRYGLRVGDVESAVKWLFVEEAIAAVGESAEKVSVSQISAITGIQRLAISEMQRESASAVGARVISPTQKILGSWQTSAQFLTNKGKPRVLSATGKNSEFAQLVRSVSKEPNPYTILQEMERSGLVERTKTGVKLKASSLMGNADAELGLSFLAEDLADLCYTVTDNINSPEQKPHHHLTTEYDAIPAAKFDLVQDLFLKEGHRLHERMRSQLAELDLPSSGVASSEDVVRVMFCSFSRVEKPSAWGGEK